MKFKSILLFCFLCLAIVLNAQAATTLREISDVDLLRQQTQAQQQLNDEHQRLTAMQQEVVLIPHEKTAEWQLILTRGVNRQDLNNAAISVTNAQSVFDNLTIALSTTRAELNTILEMQQSFLQENLQLSASNVSRVKQIWRLHELIKSIADVQQELIQVLSSEQKIASQRLALMQRWYQQLSQLYNYHLKQNTQLDLTLSSSKLQAKNIELNKELSLYTQQLTALKPLNQQQQNQHGEMEFRVFITREKITVNQIALLLTKMRKYFHPNFIIDPQQVTLLQLQQRLDQVDQNANQLDDTISQIKEKLRFIAAKKTSMVHDMPGLSREVYLQPLSAIYQSYLAQLVIATDFQADLTRYRQQLEQTKKSQLSIRQQLPLSLSAWKGLLTELIKIPVFMWHSLQDAAIELLFNLKLLFNWGVYVFCILIVCLLALWCFLRKSILSLLQGLEEQSKRFSRQVLAITLRLLRKNLGTLLLLLMLFTIQFTLGIDIALWISITLITLIFRLLINLSRIWLIENDGSVNGRDTRLYYGLKWIFILTAFFSIIIIVSHAFPVGYEVRVLCNKVFMLLLFALSILLFRSWSVLPFLIQKIFSVRRVYVMRAIRLVCAVVPITLLTNALIGLIGYVQLAWVMGYYQIVALSTLTLYMIIRGVVIDFADFSYHWLVTHYHAGWLWTQVFARPLEHIVRIVLFIGAFVVFVYWSGLNQNPTLERYWHELMHVTLVNLFGNIITVPILIESIIIIAVVYWFAKWSREFAFRWLYAKARDIGVRNSLAIFTQYAVVIIGVMIALRVLGFDLTGFAVVAAAFAAGIGIGLRDVATNFISGILLLVERPFRTGDTITLGEYEGEIVSTGMRSMKIRTWDRMELIVPNADMFTKPFINWTHQDSIVRSVIRIKIKRVDDPHIVQSLLLDLFKDIPSVVNDPPAEVYIKELDDVLIEFEIRYFLNLQIQDSRPRVRSEVLFAIWDCFKRHGIHDPDQEYTVRLLNEGDQ